MKLKSEAAQTKNITPRKAEGKECTLSGNGNVSSDNMFEGVLNSVMGVDTSWDLYEQEFKNCALPEGTVLTISSVTVQLTPSTNVSDGE